MAGTKAKTYPNTWEGLEQAAKDAGAKHTALVAAQWALESGFGKPHHEALGALGRRFESCRPD